MTLTRLKVTNFRNIAQTDLFLSPRCNLFIGENGSGKTSLLEALYYLGHGRSFRTHLASRIIRYEQLALVVHGQWITENGRSIGLGVQKDRTGNAQIKCDGERQSSLAKLAQWLPMQVIHPDGIELLTGGPKGRRAFLDWGLFYTQPDFLIIWQRYKRLIQQRNALLKQQNVTYDSVRPWDTQIAPLAIKIDAWRTEYLVQLWPIAQRKIAGFLPEMKIEWRYHRGWEKHTDYLTWLEQHFDRDKQLGYTSGGPSKADVKCVMGGIPVEDALSRGQLKLLVCALRLAQGQQFSQSQNRECVYVIDDFASELDPHRRQLLATELKQTQAQVFISAIRAEHVKDIDDEQGKKFHVENGNITAE
jgi:DNA replication and repair protein RecF